MFSSYKSIYYLHYTLVMLDLDQFLNYNLFTLNTLLQMDIYFVISFQLSVCGEGRWRLPLKFVGP